MKAQLQPDLFAGRKARDEGMARVQGNNSQWMYQALQLAPRCVPRGEVTGEDIRLRLRAAGLAAPTNDHAWGALTNAMVRRGMLTDTGRTTHATDPRSHACRIPVWNFHG